MRRLRHGMEVATPSDVSGRIGSWRHCVPGAATRPSCDLALAGNRGPPRGRTTLSPWSRACSGDLDKAGGRPLVRRQNPGGSEVGGVCKRHSWNERRPLIFLSEFRRQTAGEDASRHRRFIGRARNVSAFAASRGDAITKKSAQDIEVLCALSRKTDKSVYKLPPAAAKVTRAAKSAAERRSAATERRNAAAKRRSGAYKAGPNDTTISADPRPVI
jgi:hypothetical protein